MQSRRRWGAGIAMIASVVLVAGCNFSKTGAVAADAPDVVSVIATVTGGATTVTLDQGTMAALRGAGLSLKPTGSAFASDGAVAFPITSGYAEIHRDHNVKPGWIQGSLDHDTSGLDVVDGSKTVSLRDFVVDPGNSMLYGTVNGKVGVPLMFLDGTNVQARTDSAGQVVLSGTVAELTQTAATALDTAFATTAVQAGARLGTVQVAMASTGPLPAGASSAANAKLTGARYNASTDHVTAISRLTGQSTTLTLLPPVASALASAGVKLAPSGSATASGASVTFPITAGMVAIHSNRGFQPGYVVGTVLHQGSGVTLSHGTSSISLSDFIVNPGTSVLTGTVGGEPGIPLFVLDGSKLQVTPSPGGATLDGTVAQLTQPAAQALDATFGTDGFTAGMPIGTVHLVATGS